MRGQLINIEAMEVFENVIIVGGILVIVAIIIALSYRRFGKAGSVVALLLSGTGAIWFLFL